METMVDVNEAGSDMTLPRCILHVGLDAASISPTFIVVATFTPRSSHISNAIGQQAGCRQAQCTTGQVSYCASIRY